MTLSVADRGGSRLRRRCREVVGEEPAIGCSRAGRTRADGEGGLRERWRLRCEAIERSRQWPVGAVEGGEVAKVGWRGAEQQVKNPCPKSRVYQDVSGKRENIKGGSAGGSRDGYAAETGG
jgi:hypothetical protein